MLRQKLCGQAIHRQQQQQQQQRQQANNCDRFLQTVCTWSAMENGSSAQSATAAGDNNSKNIIMACNCRLSVMIH